MGQTGTATAQIRKSNPAVENRWFMLRSSRLRAMDAGFFAEVLSFFEPTKQGIENDPLLLQIPLQVDRAS